MNQIIYELKSQSGKKKKGSSWFFSSLSDFCLCFLCQSEHQTLSYSQTECGKGKCPYDPFQKTASAVVGKSTFCSLKPQLK